MQGLAHLDAAWLAHCHPQRMAASGTPAHRLPPDSAQYSLHAASPDSTRACCLHRQCRIYLSLNETRPIDERSRNSNWMKQKCFMRGNVPVAQQNSVVPEASEEMIAYFVGGRHSDRYEVGGSQLLLLAWLCSSSHGAAGLDTTSLSAPCAHPAACTVQPAMRSAGEVALTEHFGHEVATI